MIAIVGVRKLLPRVPDRLAGTVLVSAIAAWLILPVDTIASQYGALPRSLPVEMLDWTNPAFHPLANPDASGRLPVEGPGFRIELDQAVIDRYGVRVPLQ